MTDNTTPRELSADELAAIRERDAAMRNRTYPTNLSLADLLWAADDRAALLAHVASVDARCRAYEAALRDADMKSDLLQTALGIIKHATANGVPTLLRGRAYKFLDYAAEQFAGKRVNGEWFALDAADVEYIRGLAS